jgi:homoserine dehydrogenase
MPAAPVTVLKFGGSVLRDADDLPIAALEIYRELRKGRRVVAVVSAFAGTTERLLTLVHHRHADPAAEPLARLLETGETVVAAMLGLLLGEAGVPYVVLDSYQVGLRTTGPTLDAEPVGLDVGRLEQALEEVPVAVLPGFSGRTDRGTPSLLGRGGSDLTALYLAHRMGAARCRLLKDVDGLYSADPGRRASAAACYTAASWSRVLQVGDGVVQRKAVDYAARHRLRCELGAPGTASATRIGSGGTGAGAVVRPRRAPQRLRLGLAGCGTVGAGVCKWLSRYRRQFEVTGILVAHRDKPRARSIPANLLTDDPWAFLDRPMDVLVEVVGGTDTAAALVRRALADGLEVVTANKALVASEPEYLRAVAGCGALPLSCSASVGGAVPVLERLRELARRGEIDRVEGVLNGTCNFVLGRLTAGDDMTAALRRAQELGFAERDPNDDVNGMDSACKLAIVAAAAFGCVLDPRRMPRQGIDQLSRERVERVVRRGEVLRLVGSVRGPAERPAAGVRLVTIAPDHPLAGLQGEENGVLVHTRDGQQEVWRGKGAGRWPTTISVIGDLLEIYRRRTGRSGARHRRGENAALPLPG